jgi:redox-sensitive bicupin YhaK (pirin superfamily)
MPIAIIDFIVYSPQILAVTMRPCPRHASSSRRREEDEEMIMSEAIEIIIPGRGKDLGGFEVRRVLPFARHRMVGPFIFFDQIGPARFAPGDAVDVRPHPHIGLATVTYLFEGALGHKDSLGVEQIIRPGDVNWMTAGRGVVHSERTPSPEREDGHAMYGIQTWVALPTADEDIEPAFHHHPAASLPDFHKDGAHWRLILGTAWGHEAPVDVLSPIFYLHGELAAGMTVTIDVDHAERAVYLVEGKATLDGVTLEAGSMAVLTPGSAPKLEAGSACKVMLCGGSPLGKRQIFWNFVASSPERLRQAKADWRDAAALDFPAEGRFRLPPGENEHIPLPEE